MRGFNFVARRIANLNRSINQQREEQERKVRKKERIQQKRNVRERLKRQRAQQRKEDGTWIIGFIIFAGISVMVMPSNFAAGILMLIIVTTAGFFYYITQVDPDWGKKIPLTKEEQERNEREKERVKQRQQQKRNEGQRLKQERVQQREQKRLEEEYKRNFVFCVGCESDNPKGSLYCLECGISL